MVQDAAKIRAPERLTYLGTTKMVKENVASDDFAYSLHVFAEAILVSAPGDVASEDASCRRLHGLARRGGTLGVDFLGMFRLGSHLRYQSFLDQ